MRMKKGETHLWTTLFYIYGSFHSSSAHQRKLRFIRTGQVERRAAGNPVAHLLLLYHADRSSDGRCYAKLCIFRNNLTYCLGP